MPKIQAYSSPQHKKLVVSKGCYWIYSFVTDLGFTLRVGGSGGFEGFVSFSFPLILVFSVDPNMQLNYNLQLYIQKLLSFLFFYNISIIWNKQLHI